MREPLEKTRAGSSPLSAASRNGRRDRRACILLRRLG